VDDEQHPNRELHTSLEEELAGIARRSRRIHRDQARAVHPQLDPTALPVILVLARRSPLRISGCRSPQAER
jgi:hypothetical protein